MRRLLIWQNAPGSSPTASEQDAYDGEGNRVWQQATSVNGSTTTTTDTAYVLGIDEITTTSVTGQQAVTANIRSYPLPGGATAQRDSTGLYYLATDQLGTPIAALRLNDGTLTGTQLRTPYGQARYAAASASNGGMHTTAGFTGQHEDVSAPGSSGLTYFNAHYYDPLVGRFTSADDVVGSDPLLDGYAYVGGRVESATDPSGHRVDDCDGPNCGGDGESEWGKPGGGIGEGDEGEGGGPGGPAGPTMTIAFLASTVASLAGLALLAAQYVHAVFGGGNTASSPKAATNGARQAEVAPPPITAGTRPQDQTTTPPGTPKPGPRGTPPPGGGGRPPRVPPVAGPAHPDENGCGCGKLYRALSSSDDPSKGLYPRNPENPRSPLDHVRLGSRTGYPGDQYISTTKDPVQAVNKYAGGDPSRVVEIDASKIEGTLIDLSTDAGRTAAGLAPGTMWYNFARADSEVLVEGYIPPEAISPYTGDLWSLLNNC